MEVRSALVGLRRPAAGWLFSAVVAAGGCAGPLASSQLLSHAKPEAELASHAAASDSPAATAELSPALRKAMAESPLTQEQALASVLGQLQEIRAIDPEAERQLMADLQEVEPEDYAMIVDTFRTALAYRQQLAQRNLAGDLPPLDPQAGSPARLASSLSEPHAAARPSTAATTIRSRRSPAPAAVPNAPTARLLPAPPDAAEEVQQADYQPQAVAEDAAESAALRPSVSHGAMPLEPLEAAGSPAALAGGGPHEAPAPLQREPAAALAAGDWQGRLDATIADLQRTVAAKPATVSEMHEHMRLRTLQLLAGREEDAYRPIPGASSLQQDYWSKQLFALAAYLDSAGMADDKQRAAAALAPLDEARAKLSELATLQIRNLAFVESVDGFGSYQPRKATTYRPGQKAIVYAEVENFTSEGAEDGYHTSLGTSYQVLDQTGRRVDGKQFPDVQDKCRNRRRDFHMQYQFALPSRIYPGTYQLEVTITDHHSGKIAQSTLPFEITGQ